MFKLMYRLMLVSVGYLWLTGCTPDYHTQRKSMLKVEEATLAVPVQAGMDEPEWLAIENALHAIPLNHYESVAVVCNQPDCEALPAYSRLAGLLVQRGVHLDTVALHPLEPASPDAAPELNLQLRYRVVAFPESCPDWGHDAAQNADNGALGNYGCATATNLGLMVANRDDLLAGRGSVGTYTTTAVRAVERLNAGELSTVTTSAE